MGGLLHAGLVALALLAFASGRAGAEPESFPTPMEQAGSGTYADLVRLVVPDLAVDAGSYSGSRTIEVRDIGGTVSEGLERDAAAPIRVDAVPVRSGGLNRIALLLNFGRSDDLVGYAILALFDVTDAPRLLDAANVATGEATSFLDPARLTTGMGHDVLLTQSTHANSSQGYTTVALVLVRDDRLELVDSIFAFSEKTCAFERSQQVGIAEDTGEPAAGITATVTETITDPDGRCDDADAPRPGTREIAVSYRWDAGAGRYVASSDAFEVLARESEKRF